MWYLWKREKEWKERGSDGDAKKRGKKNEKKGGVKEMEKREKEWKENGSEGDGKKRKRKKREEERESIMWGKLLLVI